LGDEPFSAVNRVVTKMNVRELQAVLRMLEEIYTVGGAKKQAESIAVLRGALVGDPEMPVDRLFEEIRLKLSGTGIDLEKSKQPASANREVVERYARLLSDAGTARDQFDQAFGAMKDDPSVRSAECFAIANRYKNDLVDEAFEFKFDTKKEAVDFIFDTFIGRAQAQSKAGIIERVTKWANS
jgi:hypothetical protein